MKNENILPRRFKEASYENDVPDGIKKMTIDQIKKRDGLYIWGLSGVGKTHIVCAIANFLMEDGYEVLFYNTGDLLEKIREDYKAEENNREDIFRTLMDFKGILILDDIGASKTTEWVVERLYLILNRKYEDMIPIIFTSNCDLKSLSEQVGERVTSRIAGMTAKIEIDGDDKRIK